MSRTSNPGGEMPSAQATEGLMRLVLASRGRRISSAHLDGGRVWIKRFDAEAHPVAKRLHAFVSPLVPLPFLRASSKLGPAGQVEREVRKMAAFRAAGFPTPKVLFRSQTALVFSEVAPVGEHELKRLRARDAQRHDALLADMACALGRAHARGLCHGRPHPRDMFLRGAKWGFFDFEEEPEAVMPLASAQARDAWLLFMQVAGRTILEDSDMHAFERYRASAPPEIVPALRSIVGFFSLFVPVLKPLRLAGLGKDGKRLLDATLFLRRTLRAPENAAIPHHAKPTADDRHEGS